jgi:DnaK suppressor protein
MGKSKTRVICDECCLHITWSPVSRDGAIYCCDTCAGGNGCDCTPSGPVRAVQANARRRPAGQLDSSTRPIARSRKEMRRWRESFARRLETERKAIAEWLSLLKESHSTARAVSDVETRHSDPFDQAEASLTKELGSMIREQLYSRAARLERACRKLVAGNYGTCEGCGREIPTRRLEALPDALYCAPCQTERERSLGLAPSAA